MTLEQFIVVSLLDTTIIVLLLAQFIMRPRLLELTEDRDRWRHIAIKLQDNADTGDRDSITVYGGWSDG